MLIGTGKSLCDSDLIQFLFLRGRDVSFCSFNTSLYHVLTFSTLIFCSIYILTLPVLSTSGFIQILSCSNCIIYNLYCKLYIFMLRWCWACITVFYRMLFPCSYSSILNGCQHLELTLTAFYIFCTGIIGKLFTNCLFWLLLLFFIQVKSFWFF